MNPHSNIVASVLNALHRLRCINGRPPNLTEMVKFLDKRFGPQDNLRMSVKAVLKIAQQDDIVAGHNGRFRLLVSYPQLDQTFKAMMTDDHHTTQHQGRRTQFTKNDIREFVQEAWDKFNSHRAGPSDRRERQPRPKTRSMIPEIDHHSSDNSCSSESSVSSRGRDIWMNIVNSESDSSSTSSSHSQDFLNPPDFYE